MKGRHEVIFSPRLIGRLLGLAAALALASASAVAQTSQPTERQQISPPPSSHDQHAVSHEHHAGSHDHQAASPTSDEAVEIAPPEELIRLNRVGFAIPETEVIDQDGRRVRFLADLVKGRVTVVSFIYTTCLYTCTSQGKNLASLQKKLGGRLGREVFLISVSTDPETDTPAKLKSWGATFGAKAGWTFVTGERAALEGLRKAFPGVRAGRDLHDSIIFVGNDARGLWVRADALRPTVEILALLDAVAAPADARPAPSQ